LNPARKRTTSFHEIFDPDPWAVLDTAPDGKPVGAKRLRRFNGRTPAKLVVWCVSRDSDVEAG
jgi:hypothetical protein